MKPFRLLHLPHLPFRKIASEINLVFLSLCSKKCDLAVKLSGIKPITLSKDHLSTSHSVVIYFGNLFIIWSLKKREEVDEPEEFSAAYKIGELVFKTKFNGNHDVLTSLCTDYYSAAHQIVEYLKNTFNCELTGYKVSPEGYPEYRQLICQTINDSKISELNFGESGKEVNAEDIDFVFNNLKTDKMLIVSGQLHENYRLQNPLNFQYFFVSPAPWFSPEDLFNANCEHLAILFAKKLEPANINLYLKQWINGEHSRILSLRIESIWFSSIHPDRNQQFFDGIETRSFDMTREFSDYKLVWFTNTHHKYNIFFRKSVFYSLLGNQFVDYQFWDIRRNDGTIGSIALKSSRCFFHVWRIK
ncbi:hypothetical protein CRE_16420 [Caenorhabditis remanei]|uniref:Sdz-33 F-box domain-containing protein n=1 Tax=Caenorhabditis remanei TaxID=31234 RepID=E3NC68_CAERE|nr:hypothetical protein CRE_16420 [Caenorhabditis remanei]